MKITNEKTITFHIFVVVIFSISVFSLYESTKLLYDLLKYNFWYSGQPQLYNIANSMTFYEFIALQY